MLSGDPGCELQQPLGPVGYAFDVAAPGTVQLFRCGIGNGSDHFVSDNPGCEGQQVEGPLGWVYP